MATAFDLAKKQSTDWTMTDESKKKIYDLYKQNLTATWDKQAWLDATKQALLWASTTPKTPITPKITSAVDSTKLSGNLGYVDSQVWIPWVNMSWPKTTTPPKIETTADTMWDKTIWAIDTWKDLIGWNQTWFDSWSSILDKELKDIQTDKNKAVEETKKGFILWKAEFEKNKQYYTNYDTVNNLYNWVIGDLTAWMDDNGNIPDSTYQTIANKYGLTLDEVKNPQSIFNKWELSAEGKEKLWVTSYEKSMSDFETDYERKKADMKTALEQTQQQYDWQIEDVGKQLARNIGWTEAQGAWSGALRWSWYLQGIENIKKDWETTINRLKILSQQVANASEKDMARLKEDYDKAVVEAKKGFDTQLEELKKNSILALSEAQATYGMWSDKLFKTLEKINAEYGLKSNQAVSAYLTNLKSMNDLANQNISLVEKANQIEEAKINKRYTEYLANNWAVLWQTSLNTIADEVKNGTISIQKAQDLKQIMLSSIQSTLNKIAPLTTQELKTIETLLGQWFTPAQVVAELMSLDKFQKAEEDNKFWFTNVWDWVIAVTDPKTWKVRFESQSPTWETETLTWLNKIANSNIQCWKAVNTYIQDITWNYGKMWDTLDSKIQAIESIWTSDIPVKWWVFVSNPLNNTVWHTWIVQSVNSDWSITVLEANKEWKSTWWPLVENTYSAEKVKNMIFSQGLQKKQQAWWEYTTSQKAIMDTYLKNPASKQNITALKNAWLTSDDIESYTSNIGWYWTQEQIFDAIFNFSWWASKVSEWEMKLMEERAKTFASMWLNPQEAVLKYKWFNINEWIDLEKVSPYITIWDNLSANIKPNWYESTVSKYLNNWDIKWLDTYINRLVDKEVASTYKTDSILSAEYNNWLKRTNELVTLLTNNKDKVWAFDWRVNDLIKKFKDTPDYQKIKTILQMNQADMRKYFAWSAVTETEMKALEDFIWWTTKMSAWNLITMIQTLQNDRTNLFNEQRSWLSLPDTQTETTWNSTNYWWKVYNFNPE